MSKIASLEDLGPYLAKQDNTKNYEYFSDIPEICKTEPCILGIDEAGRGPVLGPMVYGITFCPIGKSKILVDLGCDDSKQLTEEKRDLIFNELNTGEEPKNNIGWAIEVISPCFISENMFKRSKHSLNEISMDSAIGLVQKAIDLGVNIAEVYVDTVGPPEKYQEKLLKIFPDFQITVAKKADSIYPIVSAASICAKVSRDHAIKVWKFEEGVNLTNDCIGSGYPADPTTKTFLKNIIDPIFGFPKIVRFSWSTTVNALDKKAYNVEFDEDEEIINQNLTKNSAAAITNFFNKTQKDGKIIRQKHSFFKQRNLSNCTNI